MTNFEKLFPSVGNTHFTESWKCSVIGIFARESVQLPAWKGRVANTVSGQRWVKRQFVSRDCYFFVSLIRFLLRPFPQKGQTNRELRRALQEHLHKIGVEIHESPSWLTHCGHSPFPAVVSEAPIYIMLLSKELYVSSAPPSILRAYLNTTLKHLSVAPQWGQRVKDIRIQNDLGSWRRGQNSTVELNKDKCKQNKFQKENKQMHKYTTNSH